MASVGSLQRTIVASIKLNQEELEYLRELTCNYLGDDTSKEPVEHMEIRHSIYDACNDALARL